MLLRKLAIVPMRIMNRLSREFGERERESERSFFIEKIKEELASMDGGRACSY